MASDRRWVLTLPPGLGMVFGMELAPGGGQRRDSSTTGRTAAPPTSSSSTPGAMLEATTSTCVERHWGVATRSDDRLHAQLVVDVQHGRTGPSRSLTVHQLVQQWWEAQAQDLSPSTRIGYRHWLDNRVVPYFGRKRISSVTTADIERWYGTLRDGATPARHSIDPWVPNGALRDVHGCGALGLPAVSPVERARVPQAPEVDATVTGARTRSGADRRRRTHATLIWASSRGWPLRSARGEENSLALRWT